MNKLYEKPPFSLKPKPISNFILLLFMSLILVACGGGGTENSAPATLPKPVIASLSLVVTDEAVSVEDNGQKIIPVDVTYTGSKALTASLSEVAISGLSITQTQNAGNFELTFLASDLLGNITESQELTITVTDGTITESATLSVSSSNTSFLQLIDKTTEELNALDTFDVSKELSNVVLYVADKAYLYGVMSHDEKATWLDDMSTLVSAIQVNVTNETKSLLATVLNQQNDLTETDAITLINQAKDVLSAAGAEFNQLSAAINALDVPNVITLEPFVISQYNGQFSLFYGNNAYGTATNNQWTFAEKWSLLNKLVPFNRQSCPANNA